jgi:hypothetical protein
VSFIHHIASPSPCRMDPLKTMNGIKIRTKTYAFIIGSPSLPRLFLVEVSRRTGTTRRHLEYYKSNVVWCPSSVASILRCLLEDQLLFKLYRAIGKATILRIVVGNPRVTQEEAQGALIEDIIAFELQTKSVVSSRTRRSTLVTSKVKELCRKTRRRRLKEEQHLMFPSLSGDVRRSLGEMHYHVMHVSRTSK